VDRFALHYVPQTHWRIWHAIWFWAMGIGSGVFCLRQFLGFSGGGLFLGMNAIDIVGLVWSAWWNYSDSRFGKAFPDF